LLSSSVEQATKLITTDITIFWFRRDLRLHDNAGLYHALKSNYKVLPVFIFDTQILDKLDDKADRRVDFIHQALGLLKKQLEELDSTLLVLTGDPVKIFSQLHPKAVYTNHDYEPYGRNRDERVKTILRKCNSELFTFKDQVIFEKSEITKDSGEPYTVFTPYSKKWKSTLKESDFRSFLVKKYFSSLLKLKPQPFPSLDQIGFIKTETAFPQVVIKKSLIENYHTTRDFPFLNGTTKLGVHLRFGTVSIRQLVQIATQTNETWLNELIWREFYHMILWHFPRVAVSAFKPAYDHIAWRNNLEDFNAWCAGKTGYPIVDAGMRELNATGFMHNRVRMIVASFLTKHLLIDWRWGEAYFASKLLDFDLAANNGGWQWASGSGCDAAPYFRIFNPELQAKNFDRERAYIKRWVSEVDEPAYPSPIVDYKFARERAIKIYRKALAGN
jgi:deoxyribodipyrimidine photo-lyase